MSPIRKKKVKFSEVKVGQLFSDHEITRLWWGMRVQRVGPYNVVCIATTGSANDTVQPGELTSYKDIMLVEIEDGQ